MSTRSAASSAEVGAAVGAAWGDCNGTAIDWSDNRLAQSSLAILPLGLEDSALQGSDLKLRCNSSRAFPV